MTNQKKFTEKGVGYYNIDNRENRDKRENIVDVDSSLDSSFGATPPQTDESPILSPGQKGEAMPQAEPLDNLSPTPDNDCINEAFVHRARFTLYDNGEQAKQRYKFGVRIHESQDPTITHDFLASLTKDMRNFKQYLPEGVDYEEMKEIRKSIKEDYDTYPYMGKLHYNEGVKGYSQRTSNEPYSWVVVWYNREEGGWDYLLKMYNWVQDGSLYNNTLSQKQRQTNVKADGMWFNPRYKHEQLTNRNKTFRDRRK